MGARGIQLKDSGARPEGGLREGFEVAFWEIVWILREGDILCEFDEKEEPGWVKFDRKFWIFSRTILKKSKGGWKSTLHAHRFFTNSKKFEPGYCRILGQKYFHSHRFFRDGP